MKGYRVLALASKVFKMDYMQSQRVERNVIESNMIFLGLLIVQNKLKEKTSSSIETLHNANLKMVMATGDNILTAISVAKECQLIDSNVPIYTCELNKENNEQVLSWNMVDTFLDREEDKSLMEENMQELNFTQAMLNGQDDLANAGITHYFHPESLGEINPSSYDSRLILADKEKDFVNKEIAQDIESEVLNIDVEKYPNKEEEFIISITGSTFEHLWKLRNKYLTSKNERYKLHYETFRLVLQNCYIYARMSPDHKTILVDCLKEEKFTVCMCGDGANDCGALRAADVGVSLSSEEASIAAPFTSNIADISCLIKLFREGKASLVSSIQTFKYMMIYSIIQFVSVTILMIFNSYLTDNQFLVSDLFIIFPMAILIARTGAYYKLTPHQPTGALISIPIVSSILLQTVIQFMAQLGIWFLLANRKWYKNYCDTSEDSVEPCMDNTAVFLVSNMQYLTTAVAFSISKPFRKPIYSNYLLCVFMILSFAYSIYIIVDPDYYSASLLGLVAFPDDDFNYYILIITLVNFILSYSVEKVMIPCITQKWKTYKYQKLYQQIMVHQKHYNLNQWHKINTKK